MVRTAAVVAAAVGQRIAAGIAVEIADLGSVAAVVAAVVAAASIGIALMEPIRDEDFAQTCIGERKRSFVHLDSLPSFHCN